MFKINNKFRLTLILIVNMTMPSSLFAANVSVEMRSRLLNVLTNQEVESYLDRNDIIFIPVGVTEMHGALPLDSEAVLPQAFALKMAEQVDGLVLANLPYFYAGATTNGRGTVQVSVRDGIDYLQKIAHSLLRQGFRRQVYISFHNPAHLTVSPVVRDFFDETSVPILYIDFAHVTRTRHPDLFKSREDMYSVFFAAYDMLGRLDDIPLTTEATDRSAPSGKDFTTLSKTFSGLAPSSGAIGYYFPRHTDHGLTPVVETAEQRKTLADAGKSKVDVILAELNTPLLLERLHQLDEYLQSKVTPRYGDLLPGNYKYAQSN